jgi:hypothetical protein
MRWFSRVSVARSEENIYWKSPDFNIYFSVM